MLTFGHLTTASGNLLVRNLDDLEKTKSSEVAGDTLLYKTQKYQ